MTNGKEIKRVGRMATLMPDNVSQFNPREVFNWNAFELRCERLRKRTHVPTVARTGAAVVAAPLGRGGARRFTRRSRTRDGILGRPRSYLQLVPSPSGPEQQGLPGTDSNSLELFLSDVATCRVSWNGMRPRRWPLNDPHPDGSPDATCSKLVRA